MEITHDRLKAADINIYKYRSRTDIDKSSVELTCIRCCIRGFYVCFYVLMRAFFTNVYVNNITARAAQRNLVNICKNN